MANDNQTPPVLQPASTATTGGGYQPIYDAAGNPIGFINTVTGEQTLVGATGTQVQTSQEYYPAGRPSRDPRFAPQGWSPANVYDTYLYSGPGIVDSQTLGVKLFDQQGQPRFYRYEDATEEFYSMPNARRTAIMDYLDRQGFDVGDTVSAIGSLWKVMQIANSRGIDYEKTMIDLSKYGVQQQVQAAPLYRVTAAADIKSVANEVAKQTMGRELSEGELAQFVSEQQQRELGYQRATSGVVESPPSLQVSAEQFARGAAPSEAAAYTYLGKVRKFMGMLGAI